MSTAQNVEFNTTKYEGIKKLKTVNVSQIDDKYLSHLQNLEAPTVSGNSYKALLANRKKEINKTYPPSHSPIASKRTVVNPPKFVSGFQITNIQAGIPLDNHLAMEGDNIVSAGNFYMAVNDPSGASIKKFTLNQFAQAAGINNQPFDPRLAYDTQSNRYFFTFLAGFESQNTDIIVAFSETDDPTGEWNVYSIPGNPNNLDQWTDYPMISITNDHVFLSINLLKDGETWQDGFIETIIWQMDKTSGYDGLDLDFLRIDGITYNGQNIRNLCPAESATETIYDDIVFISNRNFEMEADTFFLIKIDPNGTTSEELLSIELVHSDKPYGAPPNALQQVGFLQTNDARVLEAFRLDNEIQFVGNTRNLDNNMAGIFHGIIEDITDPEMVKLNHIIGPDYEIGYPGIIYTGETSSDRDAIIAFNHTSKTKFAGISALYSIPEEGYSEIVQMAPGSNYINMLTGNVERWGDYLGTQLDFSEPGNAWVSGFIGTLSRTNAPFICKIQKPEFLTNVEEPEIIENITTVFPNPTIDRTSLEIFIDEGVNSIQVGLYGMNGEKIDVVYSSRDVKSGKNSFSFDTSRIAAGSYLIKVMLDGKLIKTERIVKL